MNAESWYAIWTRSHCERLVEQQLTARGFSPFLPEVAAPRRSARRAPRNQGMVSPMFPGYLFVRDAMTKERYVEMLGVRGMAVFQHFEEKSWGDARYSLPPALRDTPIEQVNPVSGEYSLETIADRYGYEVEKAFK